MGFRDEALEQLSHWVAAYLRKGGQGGQVARVDAAVQTGRARATANWQNPAAAGVSRACVAWHANPQGPLHLPGYEAPPATVGAGTAAGSPAQPRHLRQYGPSLITPPETTRVLR